MLKKKKLIINIENFKPFKFFFENSTHFFSYFYNKLTSFPGFKYSTPKIISNFDKNLKECYRFKSVI